MGYKFTLESRNAKTGPIPTVIAGRDSCPSTCPLYRGGCYALAGPMRIHWDRATADGLTFAEMCRRVEELPTDAVWRYATAGDLPGYGNRINVVQLNDLIVSNFRRRGFTYTHKPVLPAFGVRGHVARSNRDAIETANHNGFTVNLSANNLAEADIYLDLEIAPVVTIVPAVEAPSAPWKHTTTPRGAMVVQCPAEYRDDVQCATCGGKDGPLCQRRDRTYVIGFTAHGVNKAKASRVARGLPVLQ